MRKYTCSFVCEDNYVALPLTPFAARGSEMQRAFQIQNGIVQQPERGLTVLWNVRVDLKVS